MTSQNVGLSWSFHVFSLFQALVFDSEKPAGVSEEVQGIFPVIVITKPELLCSNNHSLFPCMSLRTSQRWWWRICVCAQSRPAVKMRGVSALKWYPLQSEGAHLCISDDFSLVLRNKMVTVCVCVCVGVVCCRQIQKGSTRHGSALSKTVSPQLFRSTERTHTAQ